LTGLVVKKGKFGGVWHFDVVEPRSITSDSKPEIVGPTPFVIKSFV
jgi:hypothetical protein